MKISERVQKIPYSAIRKLTPLAEEAKAKGKKVYHLNIGAPDTKTPSEFFDAIRKINMKTLDYSPSVGREDLREATSNYYNRKGLNFDPKEEIVVTVGASEGLRFAIIAVTDIGDKILTCNPYYSNYYTVFKECGITPQTFDTKVENGYRLPDYDTIVAEITDETKAILLSNPSNPTGAVYTKEELELIAKIAKEKDLYIIADEVYREFVFDNYHYTSFAEIQGIEDRLILLDSISKRFGACGARIGSVSSKNHELMKQFVKLATSRLAAPTVEQIGAANLYNVSDKYFEEVIDEYERRRDCIYEELQKIEGVKVYKPQGAFYVMPEIPVDNAEKFAKWMLTDFEDNGETVMVAPGHGFYFNSDVGNSQIRLAYVINVDDLKRAIQILAKGIKEYNRINK